MKKLATTVWLLSAIIILLNACNDSPSGAEDDEPIVTTGNLEVLISTTGNGTDEDGYTITLNNNESVEVETDDSETFEDLEEGSYSIELSGLGTGCSIDGDNPVAVEVVAAETATVEFELICEQLTAEGTIAFTRRVDGISQIFTMKADGSDVQRITTSGIEDMYPSISPNGERIVFVRRDMESSNLDAEIWTMDIDGENQERLTDNNVRDYRPDWSADGTQIAFESDNEGESMSIFIMDANGGNRQVVTDNGGNDHSATWSADNSLAFVSDRQGDSTADIYTIQPDGTGLEMLIEATDDTGINLFDPDWSADGTQIAYQGYHPRGASGIYIANSDGSAAEAITTPDVSALQPAWSPDGKYIAYVQLASSENTDTIWITTTDGLQTLRLTDDQGDKNNFPSWGISLE